MDIQIQSAERNIEVITGIAKIDGELCEVTLFLDECELEEYEEATSGELEKLLNDRIYEHYYGDRAVSNIEHIPSEPEFEEGAESRGYILDSSFSY